MENSLAPFIPDIGSWHRFEIDGIYRIKKRNKKKEEEDKEIEEEEEGEKNLTNPCNSKRKETYPSN